MTPKDNVVVVNEKELDKKKKIFLEEGREKIHVISDFDRTLTRAFVDGKKVLSIISRLRDGDYINPDYAEKAKALAAKYHPIELDSDIPIEEKKKAMLEWWMQHFDLLINSGLKKKHLEHIMEEGIIRFRKGSLEFIDFLHEKDIPMIILSSSGLGGDVIKMLLEKQERLYDNVYVISNSFEWDKEGNAIGIKKPIIHVMNKDETFIHDFPAGKIVKHRKNVLLFGDSLGDLGMIKGFEYDNIIKIGFLNYDVEKTMSAYKAKFDILLLNDDMNYVNELMKEIVK